MTDHNQEIKQRVRTLSPSYFQRIERLLQEKEERSSEIVLQMEPMKLPNKMTPQDACLALSYVAEEIDDKSVDSIVDGSSLEVWDGRGQTFLDSLASVGIESEKYVVNPGFFPHNRDFFLLAGMGDFQFEGETVEKFYFPTIGAEKFVMSSLPSVGVMSPSGILSAGVYTDVIDSARIKLDGEEAVVYTIATRSRMASFYWGPTVHERLPNVVDPAHYELLNGCLYFLSGVTNPLNGVEHRWEYLSNSLIDKARSEEGLIVRMSGKEYRIPWKHSATFLVRDGIARDLTGIMEFATLSRDGLFDFEYNKDINRWVAGKPRLDKVRPDSAGGIKEMLDHACTLQTFIDSVPISKDGGFTPSRVSIATIPQERAAKIRQGRLPQIIGVRSSGGYKNPDSYRRILVEDCAIGPIDTMSVCPRRANIVSSCGRVSVIKRHVDSHLYHFQGDLYVTDYRYGIGRSITINLRRRVEDALNLGGPCIRVYLLDVRKLPLLFRNNILINDCAFSWTTRLKKELE